MVRYADVARMPLAVDCIVFGFDGKELKILLVKRAFNPAAGKWSLMGGFVGAEEEVPAAAARVLKKLTGLEDVYLEELQVFSGIRRDPVERVVSVAFFALIDIHRYQTQLTHDYQAEWYPIRKMPPLVFDHGKMVEKARETLRYKASLHPVLFELLPPKFTLPQLQSLYEDVFDAVMDKRNFTRQLSATGLLVRLDEKDKRGSRKGAYLYRLDTRSYRRRFRAFYKVIPNPGHLLTSTSK
jgi:ADP-ribose pyrophosphatase YjhB (NUDIX family)